MVRRIIIISLAVLIFSTNPAFVSAAENPAAENPATESPTAPLPMVDDETRQQILGATLRITITIQEKSAGVTSLVESDGLGTLVRDGDAAYIVTHDHWSHLAKNVKKVRVESAAGELLLEMSSSVFYSLIRHRDGGTMVLVAPPEMPECVKPVNVAVGEKSLDEGQTLAIAFYQPEAPSQVSVEPVTIQTIEEWDGNASMKMKSLNGKIVAPGNSGGGVFAGTQLVGNMWKTIRLRYQESGQEYSSDLSRAARYVYDDATQEELMADFSAAPARGGEF